MYFKTIAGVIRAANQKKAGEYHKEPMRIRSTNRQATSNAGKRGWLSRSGFELSI